MLRVENSDPLRARHVRARFRALLTPRRQFDGARRSRSCGRSEPSRGAASGSGAFDANGGRANRPFGSRGAGHAGRIDVDGHRSAAHVGPRVSRVLVHRKPEPRHLVQRRSDARERALARRRSGARLRHRRDDRVHHDGDRARGRGVPRLAPTLRRQHLRTAWRLFAPSPESPIRPRRQISVTTTRAKRRGTRAPTRRTWTSFVPGRS